MIKKLLKSNLACCTIIAAGHYRQVNFFNLIVSLEELTPDEAEKGKENNMKLIARLILMITIVVTATDLIEYYHLKQHPERLTLPVVILVIVVTVVPIGIIALYWHKRKWL